MKHILTLLIVSIATICNGQSHEIPLYEGSPPGSEDWTWQAADTSWGETQILYNVARPTLTVYPAKGSDPTGTSVIIAPGGGMHFLAIDHEGYRVAEWLADRGITAFVLKYRLMHTQDPIEESQTVANYDSATAEVTRLSSRDGRTAVEYVRSHAGEYNIDPGKIGFMGFSAGGTVTMSVAYTGKGDQRPDFIAPIYAYVPGYFDYEVPEREMPLFIAVASDDGFDLAPASVDIYSKWLEAGQPAELHIYQEGEHGFGMNKQGLPSDEWIDQFGKWLELNGYL